MAEHGKSAVLKIKDSGGTLRTFTSTVLKGETFNFTTDALDATTHGVDDKVMIPGLNGATFQMNGNLNVTEDGYIYGIRGVARDFEYYPLGESTGDPKYAGSCFVTNYSPATPVGGISSFTAQFQVSGAVTRTIL